MTYASALKYDSVHESGKRMQHIDEKEAAPKKIDKQHLYRHWAEPMPLGAAAATLRFFAKIIAAGSAVLANHRSGASGRHIDCDQ